MDWLNVLNQGPYLITLGSGRVELLNWNYVPYLPSNRLHRHTHFEVCQVGTYGRGRFFVEGQSYELAPYDIFIARPGVPHQIINTAVPNMELYWVSFIWLPENNQPKSEVDTLISSFADSPLLVVPDKGERVSALWRALRAVGQGYSRPGTEQQLGGLITSLLLAIAQAGSALEGATVSSIDLGAARVRLALRYIHDNLDRRLTVSEIASQINLSPRHLARLFVRHLGVSPAAYSEQARLAKAKTLLRFSNSPIKEIASTVGYGSVHHFSRAFARRVGLPPGAFREGTQVPKSQNRGP